jgi:hypothetical protein
MFKVYSHISCLTQCYIYYLTLKPYYIKKKRYKFSRPRAREKQEYSFTILLFITLPCPPKLYFLFSLHSELMLRIIFLIIRSILLLLGLRPPTSLALSLSFLLA